MVSIEAKFLINSSREDGIINRTGSSVADSTERAHHKSIFQMGSHEVAFMRIFARYIQKVKLCKLIALGRLLILLSEMMSSRRYCKA